MFSGTFIYTLTDLNPQDEIRFLNDKHGKWLSKSETTRLIREDMLKLISHANTGETIQISVTVTSGE